MKRILALTTILISIFTQNAFSQLEPVDVADLTIKVGGMKTEELYYGFAEGDQVVFSFEEVKGKAMKEIEIIELPSNSKFMDYKSTSISDKKIKVNKKSVYKFSFKNSAMGGRICKVKIQRIPQTEELISFNTDWEWKTLYDTTYVPYTEDSLVGYDTTIVAIKRKEKITDELNLITVLDNHSIEVHSKEYNWTLSGEHYGKYNEEVVQFDLLKTMNTDLKIVENIEWYYSVSVNQKMKLKAQKTKEDLMSIGGDIASYFGGPQMKIGFELLNNITTDNSDQSMYCALIPDYNNAQLFKNDMQFKIHREDNVVNSPGIRRDSPLTGTVYLGLQNPNETKGVTVYINFYVWRRTQTFHYVDDTKQNITPRYVTLNKKRMVVNTTKIRVNAD